MPKINYKQIAEKNQVLKEENLMLKDKILMLEKTINNQETGKDIYRALFENAGFCIAIRNAESHKVIMSNKTQHESLGYSRDEFDKLSDKEIVVDDPEERKKTINIINEKGAHFFVTRVRTKNGDILHRLISSVRINFNGEPCNLNIASDITQLKRTEKALEEARDELEERVERRTAELSRKTLELVESNTALKVLIQKQDEVMKDIEDRLLQNTKQLVLPHLENLKKMSPTERQMVSLTELELNLRDILSPFLKRLSNQYQSLTPAEIKVASLIREGKTSKELAEMLGCSIRTVETHRSRLRKKMGIKNNKINLQSYLQTLDNY